jgi:hypothetical protein
MVKHMEKVPKLQSYRQVYLAIYGSVPITAMAGNIRMHIGQRPWSKHGRNMAWTWPGHGPDMARTWPKHGLKKHGPNMAQTESKHDPNMA